MNQISRAEGGALSVRLDAELNAMLDRVAHHRGKSRIEMARIALRRYLEESDPVFQAELQRQLAGAPPLTSEEMEWLDAATNDWLQALDEEDGGYDWGPQGPPP